MPFNWSVDSEREMLLIACAELRPNPAVWQVVADKLGGGLTAGAVSQKFNKLKRGPEKLQTIESPKRDPPQSHDMSTGATTKRKRAEEARANRETPSRPRKKRMSSLEVNALAADDDGETKPYTKGAMKKKAEEDYEDDTEPIKGSSREPIDVDDEGDNAEEV